VQPPRPRRQESESESRRFGNKSFTNGTKKSATAIANHPVVVEPASTARKLDEDAANPIRNGSRARNEAFVYCEIRRAIRHPIITVPGSRSIGVLTQSPPHPTSTAVAKAVAQPNALVADATPLRTTTFVTFRSQNCDPALALVTTNPGMLAALKKLTAGWLQMDPPPT